MWTGPPMSAVRQDSLKALAQVSGCEIVTVTEANLSHWELPGRPLRPGFRFMQPFEKADYLRAYLTCLHGGGYSDIKRTTGSWLPAFRSIDSRQADIVGYRLSHPSQVASFGVPPSVYRKIGVWRGAWWRRFRYRLNYRALIGSGAFIVRPDSQFADLYLERVERAVERLERWWETSSTDEQRRFLVPDSGFTDYEAVLERQEAIYRQAIHGYPLHWGSLAMDIQQQLCRRLQHRVSYALPAPILENYR